MPFLGCVLGKVAYRPDRNIVSLTVGLVDKRDFLRVETKHLNKYVALKLSHPNQVEFHQPSVYLDIIKPGS